MVACHVPSGKGEPTAFSGRATWGMPIRFSVTSIRSVALGTDGSAKVPGSRPSSGTKVKSDDAVQRPRR